MLYEDQLSYVITHTNAEVVWQNKSTLPDGELYYLEPDKDPPRGTFLCQQQFEVDYDTVDLLLKEEGVAGNFGDSYLVGDMLAYRMLFEATAFDERSDNVGWLMDQLERFSVIVQSYPVKE